MANLKLAVIGKDVSKSASPEMHAFIAARMGNSVNYKKISISEDNFEKEVEELFGEYDGFNVTIPYKLSIINHLDHVEGDASVFGAVNTVLTSSRTGYNTDGLGFALMLKNNGIDVLGKDVLLLGAGGAGRSVAKKLSDAGANVFVYDRRIESAQKVASEFSGVKALEKLDAKPYYLMINATGIGMHKTEGISPVGAEFLKLASLAVDLIYTPKKSAFLEIAEKCGKKIINGSAMLFYQAYFAECIYAGVEADEMQAKRMFEEYSEEHL